VNYFGIRINSKGIRCDHCNIESDAAYMVVVNYPGNTFEIEEDCFRWNVSKFKQTDFLQIGRYFEKKNIFLKKINPI